LNKFKIGGNFDLGFLFCSRSADNGYTIDEFRNPKTAIETYRTLQIITTCFNDCMAPMAMPTMKMCIVGALIPCGYVFIRSINHKFIDEFPGICKFDMIFNAIEEFCNFAYFSDSIKTACFYFSDISGWNN